ncbi:hypothetical protein WR25_20334 [Diploscapter pachys]|uniref:PWI domain-containing protein n=1 Tax=Diploscapter pachys TaxID=2018661 RepID=A0A2A2JNK1_9BILA|nr:hypothetical protein WR25_20334 [Diploscapter pachys]
MRKLQGKGELRLKEGELPADEDDLKKDEEVRLKILNWIEKDHPDLVQIAEVSDGELSEHKNGKSSKKDKTKDKDSGRDKDRRRRSHSTSPSGKAKKARHSKSPNDKRKKSKSPKRRHGRSSSGSSTSSNSNSSDSGSSTDTYHSRSRSISRRSKRSFSRNRSDSEDSTEKRATKRMIKEKERAYMNRLKKWEFREKQKAKQYEKEERRDKEQKKNILKEAKRLKHFLEDYDDEKDDPKYYKASSLFQRKRDFEKEREADQKDRIKEQQEIEELKKQIQEENADKDEKKIEEEARKRHQQREEAALKKIRADSGSPNPHQPLGHSTNAEESSSSSDSDMDAEEKTNGGEASPAGSMTGEVGGVDKHRGAPDKPSKELKSIPLDKSEKQPPSTTAAGWKAVASPVASATSSSAAAVPAASTAASTSSAASPLTAPAKASPLSLTPTTSKSPIASAIHLQPPKNDISKRLNGVFGNFEEEEEIIVARKKLKPFEITSEDRIKHMTPEEKKKLVKDLIARIPIDQEKLFAYNIDWSFVDEALIKTRIRPWVAKKVQEYLGEEEASLVEFVCDKIQAKSPADIILKDIAVILDDDANVFVVKLWRLVIYESEAKKLGLSTAGGQPG